MSRTDLERTADETDQASARLRADYDTAVHGRETDPEAFVEQQTARLDELAAAGAAAGPEAAAIRRFLEALARDDAPGGA